MGFSSAPFLWLYIARDMDNELTPTLERVAASVIETHRRRQHLEDELATATAAVASLAKQSSALEAAVVDLQQQLETTQQAKSQEDSALAELGERRVRTIEQIDALVSQIQTYLEEKDRATNALAAQLDAARSSLGAIGQEVQVVKSSFGSLTAEVAGLRNSLDEVRRAADEAEAPLGEIEAKAKDLNEAADTMAARVLRLDKAIEQSEKDKQQIVRAAQALGSLTAKLLERKSQAEVAAESVTELEREHERRATALMKQLERIDELCEATRAKPNGSASKPPVSTKAEVKPNGVARDRFERTIALLDFLAAQGLLTPPECDQAAQLLHDGGVDKLVRSWWSRAMASSTPGYYRIALGQALFESGDSKGALTFFNRAMEGPRVDPFITYLVALALLDMTRYVDVLRIAQGLSRSKQGRTLAANIEGLHMAAGGRFDEAESKLTQALGMQGQPKLHYNETLYNLGRTAVSRGDTVGASGWFSKLNDIDPTYRDVALQIERHRATVPSN